MRVLVFCILCTISLSLFSAEPVTWQRAIDRDDIAAIWNLLPSSDPSVTNEKGKTALMSAARLGDHKLLAVLQGRGLKLVTRSKTGGTALMYAALGNQLNTIRLITRQLGNKDYLNAQSTNGWTALMIAAAKGFDETVKLLVELGADPSLADAYQWTPLMRAIDNRHQRVIRYLLANTETEIDAVNENGSTALHVAVLKGDQETVVLLLKRGANRALRDVNGQTAAEVAKLSGLAEIAALIYKG